MALAVRALFIFPHLRFPRRQTLWYFVALFNRFGSAMKLVNSLALSLVLLSSGAPFQFAHAASTPAEQDKLRIHTGIPQKASDSLFSYSPEWRIDDGELYRTTGISFLNSNKFDNGVAVAKKLVTSVKDAMIQLDPRWRGINITQPQDQAELVISNKAGYSLTSVMIKDYSNQALAFDLDGKRFNEAGAQLAIDLVLAAEVEYLENFSSLKDQTAAGGEIEIAIDQQAPVVIKTNGKTTKELEQDLAKHLAGASTSQSSLLPHIINKDTRNNKPFDGSEVQLANLAAKTLRIDVRDPSLGVLTKFKFPDENHSVKVSEPRTMAYGLAALMAGGIGYFMYISRRKQG